MKIRDLLEGRDWEKSVAADLRAKFAKTKPVQKSKGKAYDINDPHADKSTIWKKGFADGKTGKMDPKASDAYGPRTSEYEDGYKAGLNETVAGDIGSSMGGGNGFVNGGPGMVTRTKKKKSKSKRQK